MPVFIPATGQQCVILCGGLGTRLGSLTKDTPKPMLDVAGRPFLAWQIGELSRFGFDRFVLLAGHHGEVVERFFPAGGLIAPGHIPLPIRVDVLRESELQGTAGALRAAASLLDDEFLLVNGDSLCLCNVLSLCRPLAEGSLMRMGLMRSPDNGRRYGAVVCREGRVLSFTEKPDGVFQADDTYINAGIYHMRRDLLDAIPSGQCSLEKDIFPSLVRKGALEGLPLDVRYFIDIGIPEDLVRARCDLPDVMRRPAVFFDRDGVLNEDRGHVHSMDDWRWIDGAVESILECNNAGFYVFVVTNQAGLAKGLYDVASMHALHAYIQEQLRCAGAHVDAFAYCPHHPDGIVPGLRTRCCCRKPQPGMILQLSAQWPVDMARSFLIGDNMSDIKAADAAGLNSYLFRGGNLLPLVLFGLRSAEFNGHSNA